MPEETRETGGVQKPAEAGFGTMIGTTPLKPAKLLKARGRDSEYHDYVIARAVVAFLGATAICVAAGSMIAAACGVTVPEQTMSIGIAATAALGSLLAQVNR